jgi:hypothetical protein
MCRKAAGAAGMRHPPGASTAPWSEARAGRERSKGWVSGGVNGYAWRGRSGSSVVKQRTMERKTPHLALGAGGACDRVPLRNGRRPSRENARHAWSLHHLLRPAAAASRPRRSCAHLSIRTDSRACPRPRRAGRSRRVDRAEDGRRVKQSLVSMNGDPGNDESRRRRSTRRTSLRVGPPLGARGCGAERLVNIGTRLPGATF